MTVRVLFATNGPHPDNHPKVRFPQQMETTASPKPYPAVFMDQYLSWQAARKANKWQGRNSTRWQNDNYDAAYRAATFELDPVKRAAYFIRMNDLVIENRVVVPVSYRPRVSAVANKLQAPLSGWDNDLWNLRDWYKQA